MWYVAKFNKNFHNLPSYIVFEKYLSHTELPFLSQDDNETHLVPSVDDGTSVSISVSKGFPLGHGYESTVYVCLC